MTNRRSANRLSTCALVTTLALLAASAASAGWDEGVAAFKAGNYAQAIAEFQQFVEERPGQQAGYVMLGRSFINGRRASDAVAPFQKALQMKADDVASRVYLGQAFFQAGKPRECIDTLNELDIGGLQKDAQIQVYQMRSASHARLGNTGSAAADLGKVADLKPDDARARFDYGSMLNTDAQLDPAIRNFERAVSMDGSQMEWKEALVNALKVKGRRSSGSIKTAAYSRAEEAARSLVGASPAYDNLLLLGEVQLGGKNYESAASTFRQAISKKADDWHAHYYLGQSYGALERWSDAEAPLNTGLQFADGVEEARIWKYLGFVFEKQKKFAESIEAYEKGGDSAGVTRVSENQRIQQENQAADEHNKNIEELERTRDELIKQLGELPGETNEPPRR